MASKSIKTGPAHFSPVIVRGFSSHRMVEVSPAGVAVQENPQAVSSSAEHPPDRACTAGEGRKDQENQIKVLRSVTV